VEDTLTIAWVLVWTAWQGSACAAGKRLPRVVFTSAHQEHHITGMHTRFTTTRGRSSGTRRGLGEASSRRRPAMVETEGKSPTDLLGEEVSDDSNWRRR
jgi:hypothetical protein